jgi:hypothetical protein
LRRIRLWSLGCIGLLVLLLASCSTPAGPTIAITETSWTASPSDLKVGGGSFALTVSNQTDRTQTFAVVHILEGAPGSLPTVDGRLDLDARNQVPGESNFWIVYPEYEQQEGEGVGPAPLIPAEVEADSESTITIGGLKGGGEPGRYMILSWGMGEYDAGHYAVFTISD